MSDYFSDQSGWCWLADVPASEPGFSLFRRCFDVAAPDCEMRIHVSADNRYNLFLDGALVGRGPCRSDLAHYNYETYIIPVTQGGHVLSAEVVVYPYGFRGQEGPVSEIHAGSGFLVGGGTYSGGERAVDLDTPGAWKCAKDPARTHRSLTEDSALRAFYAIAPMERVDFKGAPGDWKSHTFDDSSWSSPIYAGKVLLRSDMTDTYSRWWLHPRQIPPMAEEVVEGATVFRASGALSVEKVQSFLDGNARLEVKAGSTASIIIDIGRLSTAFVHIGVTGGRGGSVRCTYAETLLVDGKKKERNHPDGEVDGHSDLLLLADGEQRFDSLWFRTMRFCRIDIDASGDDLRLTEFSLTSFLYPFQLKGAFRTEDRDTAQIWDVAWRTAQLCAHEHYYDCPYYEQLQYVGDTRIQALISYTVTGDDRLGRQAIEQFDWSRIPEGLTHSRYPSNWTQIITGFSLYWTMMVHDHYTYYGDLDFVKGVLPGVQSVLDWFERRRSGIVGHCNYWNFWDWVDGWDAGSPARGEELPITLTSLVYAEACKLVSDLYRAAGNDDMSSSLLARRNETLDAVNRECYDADTGLYTDVPGKQWYSQQTNAFAIIADAVTGAAAVELADEIVRNPTLSKATLYFTFYLFQAWVKTGTYAYFWDALEIWESVLEYDFTTFPEIPRPETRSDCHAWSSSPMYEFVTHVLGIRPGSPGCRDIVIAPNPGPLKHAQGTACMNGQVVSVEWRIADGEMEMSIACEKSVPVTVEWPSGQRENLGPVATKHIQRAI